MQNKLTTREEYLRRINIVTEYIGNHLDEKLDLCRLADLSNLSPFHFHRIIKAFLGEPIGAYITRTRVEMAARLLRYTELPVQDIAFSVGYEMPSSLSKVFNQYYGISPIEFRNNKNFTIMVPVGSFYPEYNRMDNVETNSFSATYVKLREARIEFDLSRKLLSATPFTKASIAFYGRNLLCISNYPMFDPETVALNGSALVPGIETGSLPTTRSFGANINISF